jgi:hypothetical protein
VESHTRSAFKHWGSSMRTRTHTLQIYAACTHKCAHIHTIRSAKMITRCLKVSKRGAGGLNGRSEVFNSCVRFYQITCLPLVALNHLNPIYLVDRSPQGSMLGLLLPATLNIFCENSRSTSSQCFCRPIGTLGFKWFIKHVYKGLQWGSCLAELGLHVKFLISYHDLVAP